MYSFFVRAGQALRALWLQAGICIAFLIILDILLRLGFCAFHKRESDYRVVADGYNDAPWAEELLTEMAATRSCWHPYSYWIKLPFTSRYFNIDSHGLRVTTGGKPQSSVSVHPIRIFTFGGSTMWGEGARDGYTIPSWLQRMLDATPYHVRVINYGQDAYVNSQEMLLLFEQLRKGNKPDVVIFYDGFNDSASAMISGIAGVTYGEDDRALEFEVLNPWESDHSQLYKQAAWELAMNSGMGRLARKTIRTFLPERFHEQSQQLIDALRHQTTGADRVRLQESVVTTFLANKHLIESVGRGFGFRCLFFWQPTVWTKARLTEYEARQKWLPGEREFMAGVYQRIAMVAGAEHVHDLSGVFGTSAKPYFIDDAHITEAGNRIVAQAMLPAVLQALKEASSSATQPSASLPGPPSHVNLRPELREQVQDVD
jgi:hypothetical protein